MQEREGFAKYLLSRGFRSSTIQINLKGLAYYVGWLEEQELDYLEVRYVDIIRYVSYLKTKEYKERTIGILLLAGRHFYHYLEQKYDLQHNPFSKVEPRTTSREKPLDIFEMERLEDLYSRFPNGSLRGKCDKVVLGFVIFQALRTSEIERLRLEDVDLQRGVLYVEQSHRRNARYVSLTAMQTVDLLYYIQVIRPHQQKQQGVESGLLLQQGSKSGRILVNRITSIVQKLQKLEPSCRDMHQIRASVLSHWLKSENLRRVQYKSGFKYVSSLERYRADKLEGLQQMIDKLHPLR